MRKCMYDVLDLLNARTKCIWINSYEEDSVFQDIVEVSSRLRVPMPVYNYSFASGIQKLSFTKKELSPPDKSMNIDKLFMNIYNITRGNTVDEEQLEMMREMNQTVFDDTNNIFVLKDFHLLLDTPNVKRMIRDVVHGHYKNYNAIIVVAPFTLIPTELDKLFTIVDYETPDESIIYRVLETALGKVSKSQDYIEMTIDEKEAIVNACKGLTLDEITHIFRLSIVKHRNISLKEVGDYKIELVKKSNILDYKIPDANLDEIGGNAAFKLWVDEVVDTMNMDAVEFGCERPKGYLALGIPGAAKTLMAESLAKSLNLPFLKLDMSKILDSKVGGSERNMAHAIRMIKSTAPCVLLIDEIEKTLSGLGSSNNSDSGTMARAIGSILEFLSSDHGVFVVMTSNDVSQLPPELTRAGRLDAIWYFGLPEEDERKEIFRIHFNKVGKEVSEKLLSYAAKNSSQFTGAEIREAVKGAMRKAYSRSKKDGNKDITETDISRACSEVIPVARSSREKIAVLEEYAKTRARFSNVITNDYGCNVASDKHLKRSILTLSDLK